MAQEQATDEVVELTRGLYGRGGDFEMPLGTFARNVVLEVQSLGATFEGVDAIGGFLADWRSGYADFEMKPDEISDLGNGVVFAAVRLTGRPRGAASTLERHRPFAYIWVDG